MHAGHQIPSPHATRRLLAVFALVTLSILPARAELLETERLRLEGDFRLRLEQDFDSSRADGTDREDRLRARIRARLGLTFTPNEIITAGARLRSGSDVSQQSPHITLVDFDDNDTGDADFNLDRWYLKASHSGFWGWAGRNSFPGWKQNELFWDDDATLPGLAAGYDRELGGSSKISATSGYFSLPAGMDETAASMALGQVVYRVSPGEVGLTVAAGFHRFFGDPNDADGALLLGENAGRDYAIWVASGRVVIPLGDLPLAVGADLMANVKDYDDADPNSFTFANRDEKRGHVLQLSLGSGKGRGHWLASWSYARLETFAVNSSYSQDDWLRWGDRGQTRSSDFRGHELRFIYPATDRLSLNARLYLVEALTSAEDGRRFRLDLNYRF